MESLATSIGIPKAINSTLSRSNVRSTDSGAVFAVAYAGTSPLNSSNDAGADRRSKATIRSIQRRSFWEERSIGIATRN